MPVRVSIGLPNAREGRQNPVQTVKLEDILRFARLAEELGYYSLWPNEFIVAHESVTSRYEDPPNLFDTIVTMSYVAAATERIRITPSTIVLPYHEPLQLSRQLATLDVFSGGRITLGIGLGGSADEYRQHFRNLRRPNRGRMMEEYTAALRALWSDGPAAFSGEYTSFENVDLHPKPVQRPLPILMAGHVDSTFRRIAAYGQGWINSSSLPDDLRAQMATIRKYYDEAGRGDESFEVARQFVMSIGSTEEEARAIHAAAMPPPSRAGYSPPAQRAGHGGHSQERVLIGSTEQIRNRLLEYCEVGITEICAIFFHADADTAERQLRLFAEEVMPALPLEA
jgi:probable F420-dependent oxidoreductase